MTEALCGSIFSQENNHKGTETQTQLTVTDGVGCTTRRRISKPIET